MLGFGDEGTQCCSSKCRNTTACATAERRASHHGPIRWVAEVVWTLIMGDSITCVGHLHITPIATARCQTFFSQSTYSWANEGRETERCHRPPSASGLRLAAGGAAAQVGGAVGPAGPEACVAAGLGGGTHRCAGAGVGTGLQSGSGSLAWIRGHTSLVLLLS